MLDTMQNTLYVAKSIRCNLLFFTRNDDTKVIAITHIESI